MRIALLAEGPIGRDPRARALAWSLSHVGNTVVTVAAAESGWSDSVAVPNRLPEGNGIIQRAIRKFQPENTRKALHHRALRRALTSSEADITYPMAETLLPVADGAIQGGAVFCPPGWPRPRHDLTRMAPRDLRFSISPGGPGLPLHLTSENQGRPVPSPGRHRGLRIALVHRLTPTTPARYLASALRRAGVEVTQGGAELDVEEGRFDAIVVVESPLPPPALRGERGETLLLFWVHHGEHHLGANLRLVDRLRPDAILLAHSWHLAHRFPVPVHRFPFGVPLELLPEQPAPWRERRWDVAMVGTGMRGEGGRYDLRTSVVTQLDRELGDRACFPGRVTPEELVAIYADSRVVINDGGNRHFPVTMRVFEAVGAGSLLVTEDQPGTDILLPRSDYRIIQPETIADQIRALQADSSSAESARHGRQYAMERHTYDHRVDQLVEIVAATTRQGWAGRQRPETDLGVAIDAEVDIDSIATDRLDLADELPDRTVWGAGHVLDRLAGGGRVDASVITQPTPDVSLLVAAARKCVYASGTVVPEVMDAIEQYHPDAEVHIEGGLLRAVTGISERYRVRDSS